MKRNMEVIKLLLQQQEGEDVSEELSEYCEKEVVYNGVLAIEAGLIVGKSIQDHTGEEIAISILRLTWAGHDFLDSARDEGAWNHAKDAATKSGGALSFDVLKAVLTTYVKSKLGLGT